MEQSPQRRVCPIRSLHYLMTLFCHNAISLFCQHRHDAINVFVTMQSECILLHHYHDVLCTMNIFNAKGVLLLT